MTKLNQLIAIEKGVTNRAQTRWTEIHHKLQKSALLSGITRNYTPRDEEGDTLPPESTRVQVRATDQIHEVQDALRELFNVVASKDKTNTVAGADIKIENGPTLAQNVPVPTLLYLEKKLTDLLTFVKKLPTLDPSEEWTWDDASGAWRTNVTQTYRTKKVPKVLTKAPATDKHPAQVEVFTEDVTVGYWNTVKFSGALTAEAVRSMVDRVEALQKAVKFAREEANTTEVTDFKIGDQITSYVFDS